MINYEWDCRTVWVYNEYEGLENVVYKVQYILNGVSDELDAEGNPYKSRRAGTFNIPSDMIGTATLLSTTTEAKTVEWTIEEEGQAKIDELKAGIEEDINKEISPTSYSYRLEDV